VSNFKPVGWHQAQEELLARRVADDEKLLEEYARTHSRKDNAEMRKFARQVRADIGPNGVIVEMISKVDKYICGYYMESDPRPLVLTASQPAAAQIDVTKLDESTSKVPLPQVRPSAAAVSTARVLGESP
jgi:hypothetical protein